MNAEKGPHVTQTSPRRKGVVLLASSAVLAAGVVLCTGPAASAQWRASTAECVTSGFFSGSCTTGTVRADPYNQIRVYAYGSQGARYKVWDVNTGKTVAQGTLRTTGEDGAANYFVGGLYGTYRAKIWRTAKGSIMAINGQ